MRKLIKYKKDIFNLSNNQCNKKAIYKKLINLVLQFNQFRSHLFLIKSNKINYLIKLTEDRVLIQIIYQINKIKMKNLYLVLNAKLYKSKVKKNQP